MGSRDGRARAHLLARPAAADAGLFVEVRDCLVRRVGPAILQAFQTQIAVIEAPRIGCYDASSGGWFRRHRDNSSRSTASSP